VFLLLCMVQVLVLNRIQLFHCATPLLYVYFVLMFPQGYPKWGILLWCFFLGLGVDMFSNTPGLGAASTTLVGALQPYLLELFLPREAEEQHKSSVAALGFSKFATFATILVLIFSLTFFTLEAFTFFNWGHWIGCVFGSTVLTTILIMTFENFRGYEQQPAGISNY
jgi:rod shape-determining protein MreD